MWDGMGYEVQKSHSHVKSYFAWLFRQHSWWHICHWTTLKRLAWIFCLVRCSFSTRALKQNGQEISTYVLPRTNSNHTSFWKNKKPETCLENSVVVELFPKKTPRQGASKRCVPQMMIFSWCEIAEHQPLQQQDLFNLKLDQVWKVTIHISTFSGCFGKAHSFTFPKKNISPWDDAAQRVLPVWHRSRIPWRSAWGSMDRWLAWTSVW